MSVMLFLLSTAVIEQSVTSVNCDICEQVMGPDPYGLITLNFVQD